MKMNSDFYFAMGKSHMVCQDYAYAGVNSKGNQVAVVSDGCSASPDTDFGSRYLVRSAVICGSGIVDLRAPKDAFLFDQDNANKFISNTIGFASQSGVAFHLSPYHLDATLFYLEVKENFVCIASAGDGVIFAKTVDGELKIWDIEYPSGCPFYPSYLLNEKRLGEYSDGCGMEKVLTFSTIGDDEKKQINKTTTPFFTLNLPKEKYEFVGIASDGILTFDMPFEQAIMQLTAFKNYTGSFVKRRVRRFLKECHSNNTLPTDDISMGVVYLGG